MSFHDLQLSPELLKTVKSVLEADDENDNGNGNGNGKNNNKDRFKKKKKRKKDDDQDDDGPDLENPDTEKIVINPSVQEARKGNFEIQGRRFHTFVFNDVDTANAFLESHNGFGVIGRKGKAIHVASNKDSGSRLSRIQSVDSANQKIRKGQVREQPDRREKFVDDVKSAREKRRNERMKRVKDVRQNINSRRNKLAASEAVELEETAVAVNPRAFATTVFNTANIDKKKGLISKFIDRGLDPRGKKQFEKSLARARKMNAKELDKLALDVSMHGIKKARKQLMGPELKKLRGIGKGFSFKIFGEDDQLNERPLTDAEKKKREEVVKKLKNKPGVDEPFAVATAVAKKSVNKGKKDEEMQVDEARRGKGTLSVPDRNQKKIAMDTVKNPMKGRLLGGMDATEAEKILRSKFGMSDAQIAKLKEDVNLNEVRIPASAQKIADFMPKESQSDFRFNKPFKEAIKFTNSRSARMFVKEYPHFTMLGSPRNHITKQEFAIVVPHSEFETNQIREDSLLKPRKLRTDDIMRAHDTMKPETDQVPDANRRIRKKQGNDDSVKKKKLDNPGTTQEARFMGRALTNVGDLVDRLKSAGAGGKITSVGSNNISIAWTDKKGKKHRKMIPATSKAVSDEIKSLKNEEFEYLLVDEQTGIGPMEKQFEKMIRTGDNSIFWKFVDRAAPIVNKFDNAVDKKEAKKAKERVAALIKSEAKRRTRDPEGATKRVNKFLKAIGQPTIKSLDEQLRDFPSPPMPQPNPEADKMRGQWTTSVDQKHNHDFFYGERYTTSSHGHTHEVKYDEDGKPVIFGGGKNPHKHTATGRVNEDQHEEEIPVVKENVQVTDHTPYRTVESAIRQIINRQ